MIPSICPDGHEAYQFYMTMGLELQMLWIWQQNSLKTVSLSRSIWQRCSSHRPQGHVVVCVCACECSSCNLYMTNYEGCVLQLHREPPLSVVRFYKRFILIQSLWMLCMHCVLLPWLLSVFNAWTAKLIHIFQLLLLNWYCKDMSNKKESVLDSQMQ